jgi:ABC-2 type transport system ATP-binding protein
VITFKDVDFSYGTGTSVFQEMNLEIRDGLTLLVGPNGSGKSTLLKLAAGVESPDTGTVAIGGKNLWEDEVAARRGLAYVPEQPDLTPYATLSEVMRLVCDLRGEPAEEGGRLLETTGLRRFAHRTIRQLSMGQRRRAVMAAAMIGRPGVILLDEPLGTMDLPMRASIMEWIGMRLEQNAQVLLVTHIVDPFIDLALRVVRLSPGVLPVEQALPRDQSEKLAILEAAASGRE